MKPTDRPSSTPAERRPVKAVCLLSGGLDSQLAVCLLRSQGLHVEAISFDSPFFSADAARRAADALSVPLHRLEFTPDILGLIEDAPHGFGRNMNPCRDCHALMIRRAGAWMDANDFDLLATGEVLNQRPMSQNRAALNGVARDSGYPDRLLRPLSARRLPETLPERNGWVDRSRLLDIEGRGRKRQLQLAKEFGLRDFPTPAGGCRLTEPNFCRRLNDLRIHEGLGDLRRIRLLFTGRHLRLPEGDLLIVGRDQPDNEQLTAAAQPEDFLAEPDNIPGPTLLAPNTTPSASTRDRYLRIGAAFCDATPGTAVEFRIHSPGHRQTLVSAEALARDALSGWIV